MVLTWIKKIRIHLKFSIRELSVLIVKFGQNVLSETNNYKLLITKKEELKGLPETVISAAADEAKSAGLKVMGFHNKEAKHASFSYICRKQDLRKELYNAYCMRAITGMSLITTRYLKRLWKLRAERAKTARLQKSFRNCTGAKDGKDTWDVLKLLNSLWEKAIPVAVKRGMRMQKIIDKEGGKFKLEPFDWWYYAEKTEKNKNIILTTANWDPISNSTMLEKGHSQ